MSGYSGITGLATYINPDGDLSCLINTVIAVLAAMIAGFAPTMIACRGDMRRPQSI